jgi:tripartite-type tricarboxylate transporter receptor subunit TctC
VKNVADLVALAKSKPGALNYASTSAGGSTHLAAELFKSLAKVDIVRIAYKGGGPAMNALIGGEVQVTFATAASVQAHIQAGRLRALGVTSAKPTELAPGLPPIGAAVPGYEYLDKYAIVAPAKTPPAIVEKLYQAIARALANPQLREKFLHVGVETVGSAPDDLAATIASDTVKIGKVIKDAGITAE